MDNVKTDGPTIPLGADRSEVGMAFRRHDRMLVRWLARKFGDIETARDIAQSAYLRVWRYSQTQKIDNLQALIFKTAANLAANEFRARKRLQVLNIDASASQRESLVDQVPSEQPTPEAVAVAREEIAASLRAIEALPALARRAFVLSRFEEKTYREIAELLDVSESSVEKYIIAALKALRMAAEETGRSPKIIPLPNRRNRR